MADRHDYVLRPVEELLRKRRAARDRIARATTTEDVLADMYTEQEIEAALQMKEEDKRYV
jgi:hypothetical protein